MKLTLLMPFILSMLALSCMTSCKKEAYPVFPGTPPQEPAQPITLEELAGSYVITGMSETTYQNGQTDVYNDYYDDCKKDDVYTLNTDMSLGYSDEGTQCTTEGYRLSNWSFSSSDNTINIAGELYTIYYHNSNILMLTSETHVGRNSGRLTTTFTKD